MHSKKRYWHIIDLIAAKAQLLTPTTLALCSTVVKCTSTAVNTADIENVFSEEPAGVLKRIRTEIKKHVFGTVVNRDPAI